MSDNPLAFPFHYNDGNICSHDSGMTLRDYFAAAALQGMCANTNIGSEAYDKLALWSYDQADAMLAQRNKK